MHGLNGASEEIIVEFFELGAGEGFLEVEAVDKVFDFDVDLLGSGKPALAFLNFLLQFLDGSFVTRDILVVLLGDELDEVVDDALVKVLSSQVSVTGSGNDLENSIIDSEDGDVESTASQVEDENVGLVCLAVEAVSDGSGSGLIEDSDDVEACDGAGVLSGLTLGVVKVGGNCDDGVDNLLAEVSLGDVLHLGEDHGTDFLRGKYLALAALFDLDVRLGFPVDDFEGQEFFVVLDGLVGEFAADETFDVVKGSRRIDCCLILGGFSDETLVVSECNNRGSDTVAELVGDDFDMPLAEDSDARVGGTQVNSDDRALDFGLIR